MSTAQGSLRQGTGGSNAAHFVPGVNEINLTRTKGAGTLAHEWGHALDHYFATQAGLSKEDEPFLSNHASRPDTRERMVPEGGKYVRRVTPTFAESVRPEIVQAFRRIHEAMTRRAESAGEAAARREATLPKERKRLDGWLRAARQPIETSTAANKADLLAEFDQHAEKLRQGDVGDGYEQAGNVSLSARVAAVRNLIKDATGRLWPLDETRWLDDNATFVRSLQGKKDADATHEPQRVATQFMADSTALDAAKGGKAYWSTPHEMFARAFELYVHDRLAAQGNSNTFLTDAAQRAQAPYQVVDRSSAFNRASGAMRDLYVYPIGKEREALVEAFDALVGEIKTRETDAGVALFSRTGTGPGLSHAQAADAVDALLEPFEHAVPTRILESATGEIPGAVPDDHVSGAVHRGRVHLFLDELADRPALVRTLWHELLHYGLRRFLSRDEYIARMGELYGDDAWVRDRADDWMRSEQGRGVLRDHGMDYARARGVDEALGDLAETLGGAQDPRGALRRTLDAVTEWLARLADVFGFDAASTWLRTAPRQATARYVRSVFERLRDDAAATSSDWAFTADPAFASAPREVTYTITKVGRKWLEGKQSGKPYTNQIEINDASSGWKIGDTVTFMARTEFTSGRYGTTVQVFPMTAEAVASERAATENARNLAEIRRQLDFIEDSASRGQRYANGVDKVMALGIAAFPAEKARLDDALAKVRTASAAPRTYLRVAYAEKEQAKAHGARWDAERRQWYVHGAVPKALERFLPEQAGARPADAPRDRPATDTDRETLRIDRGSGYGGRPFSVGQVLRNPGHARNSAEPEFVTVLSASQRYFREDGLSFGVGDDQGYIYSATVRPATEAETALLIEREQAAEQAAEQRRATLRAVDELRTTFIRDGERPNPAEPAGEVLLNTFTIYGGGERWHIDREGGSIWYVRNNGADGDNWTANNVRTGGAGAIGWRMPWSAQAEHVLRDAALLKPGQTASRVLFSRSDQTQQQYEARIDALFAGQPAARIGARVLDRSDLLDLLGMGDGAVHLAEGKVRAGMDSHPRMTAEVWKKIPQWLDDPAAVFDSDTVKGRMVFVAPELVAGSPVLIVVEPNAEIGATLQAHLLVNAYDKDRAPPFARWLRDDLARYVDQKKFPDVLARAGLQLPRKAENKPGTARILTEKNLAGYRRAAMSRGAGPGTGLPADRVTAIAAAVSRAWTNPPGVVVVADMADPQIPAAVRHADAAQRSGGAAGDPEGFFYDGKVYLVAGQLATPADVVRVLAHEALGHYGLRGLFGDRLAGILDQIAAVRRAEVDARRTAYGLPDTAAGRRVAAEEVLAGMAQTSPQLGFVRRAVAAIRTWLRGLGLNLRMTDDEIIRSFILPARAWVQSGAGRPSGAAVFSRGEDITLEQFRATERAYGGREAWQRARDAGRTKLTYGQWVTVRTPAFKAWFGDWEALRAQQRLDAMEPIEVPIPGAWAEFTPKQLRAEVGRVLDAMVKSSESIAHPELGEIRVNRTGERKTISEGRDPAKLLVAADLRNVVPASIWAATESVTGHPSIVGYAKLLSRVRVGGVDLVAVISVREQSDGRWYYNAVTVQDQKNQAPDETGAGTAGPVRGALPMAEGLPLLTAIESFVRRPLVRVNPDTVSKVVDENGEPLVVYHGTDVDADFTEFDTMDIGSWFAESPSTSENYANRGRRGPPRTVPAYLSIRRPLVIPSQVDLSEETRLGYALDLINEANGTDFRPSTFWESNWDTDEDTDGAGWLFFATPEFVEAAKSAGFDGMFAYERGARTWDAFEPEQIKSATGNTGAFDPENPDIRFSRTTLGDTPQPAPAPTNNWQRAKQRAAALTAPDKVDRLLYEFQDRFIDLKRIREHITSLGATISDLSDAYLGEELYHKRVAHRTEKFLDDELKPLLALQPGEPDSPQGLEDPAPRTRLSEIERRDGTLSYAALLEHLDHFTIANDWVLLHEGQCLRVDRDFDTRHLLAIDVDVKELSDERDSWLAIERIPSREACARAVVESDALASRWLKVFDADPSPDL